MTWRREYYERQRRRWTFSKIKNIYLRRMVLAALYLPIVLTMLLHLVSLCLYDIVATLVVTIWDYWGECVVVTHRGIIYHWTNKK